MTDQNGSAGLTNTGRCQQGQWVTLPGRFSRQARGACLWVKQSEVKTRPPIGSVAWSVGIIFTADFDANWLLPNLQNLADLKNEGNGPFAVLGGSVQSAVVSVLRVKVVWVFVVYEMNGWTNISLTLLRCSSITTDQSWFINTPMVHGPSCFNAQKWVRLRMCLCQERMCSSRIEKRGAETPDQSEWTRLLRREEKTLRGVAKAILRTVLGCNGNLRHIREVEKIVLGSNWTIVRQSRSNPC